MARFRFFENKIFEHVKIKQNYAIGLVTFVIIIINELVASFSLEYSQNFIVQIANYKI
jgi:hypothetical protein